MPRPFPADQDPDALRALYELEKSLADRLREADRERRQSLYGEVYDQYFRSLPQSAEPHPSDEQTHLQRRLLGPFLGSSTVFLEVGSGDGTLARSLAPEVRQVWSVEASNVVASSGRVPDPKNFRHVTPELAQEEVTPASVDLAFSCHFLEHLHPDDVAAHFRQILGWLKPGAPYVSVTPNRLHGPHDISGYFADVPEGFHLREYAHFELAAALRAAGFSRVEALLGTGSDPVRSPLLPVHLLERGFDWMGRHLRRILLHRLLAHRAPFRPLEQVKLVAWKRGDHQLY